MKQKTFVFGLIAILVIFILLMLWGCNRKSGAGPRDLGKTLSQPFEAEATIRMKGLTLQSDINRTAAGTATFVVTDPPGLKDMQFQYNGDEIAVSYKGMTLHLDGESKLAGSMAALVMEAIEKASSDDVKIKLDGNALCIAGESEAGEFDMRLDRKNGSILSLSFPELDFECSFEDFIFQSPDIRL